MTLPTDIILPFRPDQFLSDDPVEREKYQQELVNSLTSMYQDLARTSNGTVKSVDVVVKGANVPGTGTYSHQVGWVRRQGNWAEFWFDVQWTNHTGNGVMYVELPYKTKKSLQAPWIGVVQASTVAFGGGRTYLTINAAQDTFRGEIWANGTGVAAQAINLASPGRLQGHISYLGQEFA